VPNRRGTERVHRLLAHTADAGFEVRGASLPDVYAKSAVALFHVMGRPAGLAPTPPFRVEATGADREDLLVRILADLLTRFELEGRFVTDAVCESVTAQGDGDVRAVLVCEGGTVDRDREASLTEIKAVTYHGLEVREERGRLRARVFVDL